MLEGKIFKPTVVDVTLSGVEDEIKEDAEFKPLTQKERDFLNYWNVDIVK